jgi:hypothetical protein
MAAVVTVVFPLPIVEKHVLRQRAQRRKRSSLLIVDDGRVDGKMSND